MIYFGIVESRKDPLKLGRVQVRVFGLHTDKNTYPGIPTSYLHWSTVVTPSTSSSMSGIGQTPNIVEGSMVMVLFNDESLQYPVVLGTVPGLNQEFLMKVSGVEVPRGDKLMGFQDPDNNFPYEHYKKGDNGTSDLPMGAVEDQDNEIGFDRTDDGAQSNPLFGFQEPEDLRKYHKYPHNQIRQSERGHFEEWDNTYGNERINKQHRSGTFEEIRPDGTRVQKIVNQDYTIISTNQYIHIKATEPSPRDKGDNTQEPYTANSWGWDNVNEPPPESPTPTTPFGRHIHIDGVDDLYVKDNKNVHIVGNHNVTIEGNETVYIKGNQSITVDGNVDLTVGGNVTADITGNVAATIGGYVTADITGDFTVNNNITTMTASGGQYTVNSSQINLNGNVAISGTLNVTGVQTNASSITASGEVTGRGKKLSTHTHKIVSGSSAGTTSTPT